VLANNSVENVKLHQHRSLCTNVLLNTSSRAQVWVWNSAHPGFARLRQGIKNHSALEQRRPQLQNQWTALHECFVDYEFRALQVSAWNDAHPGVTNGGSKQTGK